MGFAEIRKKHGYTQQHLAGLLGVSQSTVAQWENGQSTPTMKHLLKLTSIFNIDLAELVASFKKNRSATA